MKRRLRHVATMLLGSVVVVFLSVVSARAQDVATNFQELRLKVGPGVTIYVTEPAGGEYAAKVVSISSSALVVNMDGKERELTEAAVRRIRQRLPDSLWTGALVGLGIGAGLGGLAAAFSDSCSYEGGMQCVGPAVTTGLVGAGAGVGIDALIKGKKVIYEAGPAKAVAWNLSPLVSRHMAGGRLTFAF